MLSRVPGARPDPDQASRLADVTENPHGGPGASGFIFVIL
jgi:hypothetical protein